MATQYTSEQYEKTAEQRGEHQRPSVPAGLPQGAQPPRPGSALKVPGRVPPREATDGGQASRRTKEAYNSRAL